MRVAWYHSHSDQILPDSTFKIPLSACKLYSSVNLLNLNIKHKPINFPLNKFSFFNSFFVELYMVRVCIYCTVQYCKYISVQYIVCKYIFLIMNKREKEKRRRKSWHEISKEQKYPGFSIYQRNNILPRLYSR